MAKLGSLGNELFRYRKRKRSLDGSAPGAPYARFRKSLRYVSGMPYIPRQEGFNNDLYNWGQPRQYHPNINSPAVQSNDYIADPEWESHEVPHSGPPHLFKSFPDLGPDEPPFNYNKVRAESDFFLTAMEEQYKHSAESQEFSSLDDIGEAHFAGNEQDIFGMDVTDSEIPAELSGLTAEEIAGRVGDIATALGHLQTVFPDDHPDIIALKGAFREIFDDPDAVSKLESLAGEDGPSNLGVGDPYENDPVEQAAYALEQTVSMTDYLFGQPLSEQVEFQGYNDEMGIEPMMATDPLMDEAQMVDEPGLEQIIEHEDVFSPAPMEVMDYDMMSDDIAMEIALPGPMDELQSYDAISPIDEIHQVIDQAMELPGMQEPVPDPWQVQYDPFATAQSIFDQQMQFMANPLMMPGMGPMGPMPGPAPM